VGTFGRERPFKNFQFIPVIILGNRQSASLSMEFQSSSPIDPQLGLLGITFVVIQKLKTKPTLY